MISTEVRLGAIVIGDGALIEISETTQLAFRIRADELPALSLADESVPLIGTNGEYAPTAAWLEEHRTRHLVGDVPMHLDVGGHGLDATIRRLPSRVTLDEYHYLLDRLRRRLGPTGIEDPLGRAKIWAALAPRIPAADEERVRVLLGLFRRVAPSLRRIAEAPRRSLAYAEQWIAVRELGRARGRIDGRRTRRWDPPRPASAPVEGSLLLRTTEHDVSTPENRYVLAVALHFVELVVHAASTEISPDVARHAIEVAREVEAWFGGSDWIDVLPGGEPGISFILRDDPDYAAISALAVQMERLPGLLARFPPDDPARLFPLNPYSLNALYERWVQLQVWDWAEREMGPAARPFEPSGIWQWGEGRHAVRLVLDVPYPRSGRGVIAPIGKNRPDVAVELWNGPEVEVLTLDATYSQQSHVLGEKLQYAANLRNGESIHPLTGDAPLVVRWAAYARPAHVATVLELGAGLSRVDLALPPRDESAELLHRYLDATIGQRLPRHPAGARP